MEALNRLIELEKSPPKSHAGVKTQTKATIRLDNSPLYEYIEVTLGSTDQPISARLYTRYGEDQLIPHGTKLWEWVEEIIEENF